MESHNSILNEYQSSDRKRRDHMWMKLRFFRSEFDEIEKRESTDTCRLLKKNKVGQSFSTIGPFASAMRHRETTTF